MRPALPLVLASLLVSPASHLHAQAPIDPSGHWEGSVQGFARFEVDLIRNDKGGLSGTVNMPDEGLKGLPLIHVEVEDGSIAFYARTDQRLEGAFSADGKAIAGDYSIAGFTIPFSLTRTGEARIEAPPRSARITRELEGTWNGTLNAGGESIRLRLSLANQPDDTATGNIVNLDQGGLTIPVAIAQQGSQLTLDARAVNGSYSGALNADGTELVGTFKQGAGAVALTFRRAADGQK